MAIIKAGSTQAGLRGKVGKVVVTSTARGTVVREYVVPRNPRTPKQILARSRQTEASRAWSDMEPEAIARWKRYADEIGEGKLRPMNVFSALYCRILLVDPTAPAPLFPPVTSFEGDNVAISAVGGADALVFAADQANTYGVVTQLLIQPLESRNRRTYLEKYRHTAIVPFSPERLTRAIALAPGWYAVAHRFIRSETGQATELVEGGVFRVV